MLRRDVGLRAAHFPVLVPLNHGQDQPIHRRRFQTFEVRKTKTLTMGTLPTQIAFDTKGGGLPPAGGLVVPSPGQLRLKVSGSVCSLCDLIPHYLSALAAYLPGRSIDIVGPLPCRTGCFPRVLLLLLCDTAVVVTSPACCACCRCQALAH